MNNIIYASNCTTIRDCYEFTDKGINIISKIICRTRKEKGLKLTRTWKSYACEIKAHKRLYKLGIKKDHTKDADCEEPIERNKEILYRIIGI